MIVKSNFSPSSPEGFLTPPTSAPSSYNATFAGYKLGAFISYGMNTYRASDSYAVNSLLPSPVPSTFAPPSNILSLAQGWVDSLFATGKVDYYVLTVTHNDGFSIWNTAYNFPTQTIHDATLGTITVPQQTNYKHSTYDIVGTVVNRVKSYGKPIYLYYNMGKRSNDCGSNFYGNYSGYVDTMILQIKELIDLYNPDGFWLDAPGQFPFNTNTNASPLQKVYSFIRRTSPNCHVSLNFSSAATSLYTSSDLTFWPTDCYAIEYDIGRSLTNTNEYNYTIAKTKGGVNYYTNCEIITSNNSQGYYFGAVDKGATFSSQATIQGYYNYAKSVGCPHLLNVSISQDGTLSATQLNYFVNMSL